MIGISCGLLLSGSVVTETVFSIPGMGQLLTQAVLGRDYPMVQGGLLLVDGVPGAGQYRRRRALRRARSAGAR